MHHSCSRRLLLCRHEGTSSRRAASRQLQQEPARRARAHGGGHRAHPSSTSRSPTRSRRSTHLEGASVHIIFTSDVDGSLRRLAGHRLFAPDELDGVGFIRPNMQHFQRSGGVPWVAMDAVDVLRLAADHAGPGSTLTAGHRPAVHAPYVDRRAGRSSRRAAADVAEDADVDGARRTPIPGLVGCTDAGPVPLRHQKLHRPRGQAGSRAPEIRTDSGRCTCPTAAAECRGLDRQAPKARVRSRPRLAGRAGRRSTALRSRRASRPSRLPAGYVTHRARRRCAPLPAGSAMIEPFSACSGSVPLRSNDQDACARTLSPDSPTGRRSSAHSPPRARGLRIDRGLREDSGPPPPPVSPPRRGSRPRRLPGDQHSQVAQRAVRLRVLLFTGPRTVAMALAASYLQRRQGAAHSDWSTEASRDAHEASLCGPPCAPRASTPAHFQRTPRQSRRSRSSMM